MCARRASGGNSSDFDLTRLSAVPLPVWSDRLLRAIRIGRDAVLTTGVLHAADWGSKVGDHIACNTGIGC